MSGPIVHDINLTGVNITTGAASASSALPVGSAGGAAKSVRVAATVNARVRVGLTGLTAVATDFLVTPNEAIVIDTRGCTHVAAIQDTAAGVVNVAPVEN